MNKIYSTFLVFLSFFVMQISASQLTIAEVVDFESVRSPRRLVTFTDDSRWFIPYYHSHRFDEGQSYHLDAEDPQPQNRYDFIYSYHNSEYDDVFVKVPALMLSNTSLDLFEDTEGTLSTHLITNKFVLPGAFSADDSIIELDDGRIWLVPTYQNTFNIGDSVSAYIENEDLTYLIKTVQIAGAKKEILMPSKRISKGFYQIR
jgi:hypothetical protein